MTLGRSFRTFSCRACSDAVQSFSNVLYSLMASSYLPDRRAPSASLNVCSNGMNVSSSAVLHEVGMSNITVTHAASRMRLTPESASRLVYFFSILITSFIFVAAKVRRITETAKQSGVFE